MRTYLKSNWARILRNGLLGFTTGIVGDALHMSTASVWLTIAGVVGVAMCQDEMADAREGKKR